MSLIAARAALTGVEKLPYDEEVWYLESTGTQWIDTGVAMSYSRVVFGGTFSEISDSVGGFAFGFTLASSSNHVRAFYIEGTANARVLFNVYGGTTQYGEKYSARSATDGEVDFTTSPHSCTIGSVNSTFTSTDWEAVNIFAFGTGSINGKVRIHRAWIEKDGMLIRDMSPVRFTNENGVSEGAMYDRANPNVGINRDGTPRTDGLYLNRGAGSFILPTT